MWQARTSVSAASRGLIDPCKSSPSRRSVPQQTPRLVAGKVVTFYPPSPLPQASSRFHMRPVTKCTNWVLRMKLRISVFLLLGCLLPLLAPEHQLAGQPGRVSIHLAPTPRSFPGHIRKAGSGTQPSCRCLGSSGSPCGLLFLHKWNYSRVRVKPEVLNTSLQVIFPAGYSKCLGDAHRILPKAPGFTSRCFEELNVRENQKKNSFKIFFFHSESSHWECMPVVVNI